VRALSNISTSKIDKASPSNGRKKPAPSTPPGKDSKMEVVRTKVHDGKPVRGIWRRTTGRADISAASPGSSSKVKFSETSQQVRYTRPQVDLPPAVVQRDVETEARIDALFKEYLPAATTRDEREQPSLDTPADVEAFLDGLLPKELVIEPDPASHRALMRTVRQMADLINSAHAFQARVQAGRGGTVNEDDAILVMLRKSPAFRKAFTGTNRYTALKACVQKYARAVELAKRLNENSHPHHAKISRLLDGYAGILKRLESRLDQRLILDKSEIDKQAARPVNS